MSDLVSIIIPAYNQVALCRECIESIQRNTNLPYRLILVDNGSTDGVAEYFDTIPEAEVVHSPVNRGFAGGVNLGLARVTEGHALLLNSDTLVTEDWLERLKRALLAQNDVGMVAPMSNYVAGYQLVPNGYDMPTTEASMFAARLAETKRGTIRDVNRLVGLCVLIRETALRTVGFFDEAYGLGNYEDDDYCVRLMRAGYRLCIAQDAFIYHYGSRTFESLGVIDDKWQELVRNNRAYFQGKWGRAPFENGETAGDSRWLNSKARQAFANGDTFLAARLLQDAILLCPKLALNYNDLGTVLWESREFGRALTLFEKAVALAPDDNGFRENLRQAAAALDRPQV